LAGGGRAARVGAERGVRRRRPPEGADGLVRAVRQHKGDGAVQAKGRVVQVLKHVQVVQAVRVWGKEGRDGGWVGGC
jgi:hypothetical protein